MSGCDTAVAPFEIRARCVDTLQMNITRLCNQECTHCHVSASPRRREMMRDDVIAACIAAIERFPEVTTVDVTGGAPELHPSFPTLVRRVRALERRVMVRHNLTVTSDPHPITGDSMAWLPSFFAAQGVELCCSLPCYSEENTDGQRGAGVFGKSVEALRGLNREGYGRPGSGLVIDLVHNPTGASLPGSQRALESDYRRELADRFGVVFNRLLTITNMPLGRFAGGLAASGRVEAYDARVHAAFDESLAPFAMCRSLVSVGLDGTLYDCDFNQMAGLPVDAEAGDVFGFAMEHLAERRVRTSHHCEVCLCGEGSSCGGALRPEPGHDGGASCPN